MHCWARYVFLIVVAALGTLSLIGACGRKGPLYLPEPTPAPTAEQAPASGADVPKAPAQGN